MPLTPVPVRHPQHQVSGWPRLTRSAAHPDAREHRLDLETHVPESRGQQQVALEAIPAPPAGHKLPLEVRLPQRDRDASVGVEVLERDRPCARLVDRLPGRVARRVQPDTAKVCVEVEHPANRNVARPSELLFADVSQTLAQFGDERISVGQSALQTIDRVAEQRAGVAITPQPAVQQC